MNEDYPPNLNLSLSDFQNQNKQPYDSFDMSVEYNDKRAAFDPFSEQPKNSLPPLQSVQSNRVPPPLISSINSANSRNQAGNISGQNDPNRPTTFGGLPPDQHPNQSQSHDRRSHEADNHIFSFRRDHNQGSLRQDRNQENIVNIENQATSPTNENGSYEKTRKLVLKLKKCYIFYFLNLLYFGFAIFNLIIAYQNEDITFSRLENIEYQFSQKIILDLSVVSTSESCKDPYTGTQAGTWPGIKQICKCSSETFLRACEDADLQAGCEPLGEYKPVTGVSWDGKKICLRKSDKSFFEYYQASGFMESYSGNLLCPNSQKKCIMSLTKNFICVGRLESCPLTQIEINSDDSQNIARLRAQVALGSKTLAYDTQGSNATTVMDIFIEPDQCNQGTLQDEEKSKYCSDVPQKKLLDSESEYIFLQDNSGWATQDINNFQTSNTSNQMNLYTSPMNYLDMCVFNSTFNPVIVSSQLANWNVVKYLLFINPFFMTTLLVLNILRALMIKYINAPEPDRILQKRKKEIYILFGSSFGSSSLIITGEILTMLYYIFWGYLLLNPDRMLAEKWLAMSCIDSDVKTEIQFMVNQFLKIEAYNMMIIGPMIFGCVMEAIFSQVRLMIRPYSRISRDDSIRE